MAANRRWAMLRLSGVAAGKGGVDEQQQQQQYHSGRGWRSSASGTWT